MWVRCPPRAHREISLVVELVLPKHRAPVRFRHLAPYYMSDHISIDKKYIPLDKYWIIRMGVLDLINGYDDINNFLDKQSHLGDDLLALKRASKVWKTDKSIDVGESGTLYRFLQFASWKLCLNKKFIRRGKLVHRKVCSDPKIIHWNLKKLLILDGGTSQWASAAVLLGNAEKLNKAPFFLQRTLEAKKYWEEHRKKGKRWEAQYDGILSKQAKYFIKCIKL